MPSRILTLGVRAFQVRPPPPPPPPPRLTSQIFVCLVSLAITGNMLASPAASKPAILSFDLFVVVFAMLSLAYLTLATAYERFVFNPLLLFGLDMINTFWLFCGSVATAAGFLGTHSCSNKVGASLSRRIWLTDLQDYLKSNKITSGAMDQQKRCHEAQATTVFMFFAMFGFIATTVVSALWGCVGGSAASRVQHQGGRTRP